MALAVERRLRDQPIRNGVGPGNGPGRELIALDAKPEVARQVAANSRCWWRNSGKALHAVLTLAWSDQLGLPRLS